MQDTKRNDVKYFDPFSFPNDSLLILGGTGSLGQKLTEKALDLGFSRIIIFSRHEHLQVEMKRKFPSEKLRFFIGDIRDKDRLKLAFNNVSYVINAAALKHIDVCYYNPSEVIKTNVIGIQNIIEIALDCKVHKVLNISTDKAVKPVNLYGGAKFCGDMLMVASNVYATENRPKFSCARFGNFWGSRGSIIELLFQFKERKIKIVPITNISMKRYFISLDRASDFCFKILKDMQGGEIFIPKMKEEFIVDLAKKIIPDANIKEIGIRVGEKVKEDLIAECDKLITKDCGGYWVTKYL